MVILLPGCAVADCEGGEAAHHVGGDHDDGDDHDGGDHDDGDDHIGGDHDDSDNNVGGDDYVGD